MPSSVKSIRPCIPTTAKAIPQGDAWLHEPKLDGYRLNATIDPKPFAGWPTKAKSPAS